LTPQDDENNSSDVFLWDDGDNFPVSVASDHLGMGNKASFGPSMPSSGTYIAYYTSANDIVAGCGDQTGEPPLENDIVIYTTDGSEDSNCVTSDTGPIASGASVYTTPSISRNGRTVVFESEISLVTEDDNAVKDIYSYDRAENSTRYISQTSDGSAGNNDSNNPVISGLGLSIAFESKATNFVDGTALGNIYVTDLEGMINYGPPSSLSASNITSNQVTLSWNDSIDAEFIEGYRIYQNNTAVATTPEIEITLSDLSCNTDYNFKVRAYSGDQESIPSNTVTITTDTCSTTAEVQVSIGDNIIETYSVEPYEDKRLSYDLSGGPMIIESLNEKVITAAIRLQSMNSGTLYDFNETIGIPESLLSYKYYFPVYENKWAPLNSQIRFAHLGTGTKKIKVTIAGEVVWYDDVPEGTEKRLFFDISGGPVIVESDDGVTKLIAAIRLQGMKDGTLNHYSETNGIPEELLSYKYYFPVYENKWAPLNSQIRFAHFGTGTKKIKVTIAGEVVWYDDVPEATEKRLFFDISGGPAIVESDDGITKVVAAIRLQSKPSHTLFDYNETIGIPEGLLSSKYYFP